MPKKLKYYYDKELAELLAQKIVGVYPDFNELLFIKKIAKKIDKLELKARVEVFADCLYEFLPENYKETITIIHQILGPENTNETGMFTEGYWLMPIAFYVEKYGLEDFDTSIQAIYEITKRHTGEFTIRPYLVKYPVMTLEVMKKWSKDKNVHVRRLASEGVRPRLPLAKKLVQYIEKPELILSILENLKEDDSKFVQKSVANCLNDILKDNYEIAMNVLRTWSSSSNKNTKWIVKHALRKELKKENPEALKLIHE
jgi:3-methyladenine DNA glycosylase AlkC